MEAMQLLTPCVLVIAAAITQEESNIVGGG